MIDYSIIFNRIEDDKKTIHYSTDSSIKRFVTIRVYNSYLKFKEYEQDLEISPGFNYWTYIPNQLNHRYVEFRDKESLEIVGLFGLEWLYEIENIDHFNYVSDIFKHLSLDEKENVYFVFREISIDNIYHNDFVDVEENDLVVDIGFNYGLFSLESLKRNPLKIIGFEPNLKLVNIFKKYIDNNKIEIHQKAVSDMNGVSIFHEKENPGLSSIFEDINILHPGISYDVEVISFYDFILDNNIEKIDYLKVDCEGSEYSIFDSLPDSYLSDNINKIAIEFHHNVEDPKVKNLIDKLIRCGFTLKISQEDNSNIGMIYGKK